MIIDRYIYIHTHIPFDESHLIDGLFIPNCSMSAKYPEKVAVV